MRIKFLVNISPKYPVVHNGETPIMVQMPTAFDPLMFVRPLQSPVRGQEPPRVTRRQ
jgi:hypothetical protein